MFITILLERLSWKCDDKGSSNEKSELTIGFLMVENGGIGGLRFYFGWSGDAKDGMFRFQVTSCRLSFQLKCFMVTKSV